MPERLCINCQTNDINTLRDESSGCSDKPKGKCAVIKWKYWCNNCKGLYQFVFTSEEKLTRELLS